jgi:hypothetical protein
MADLSFAKTRTTEGEVRYARLIAEDETGNCRKKLSWFIARHVVICLKVVREVMKNHKKASAKPRF